MAVDWQALTKPYGDVSINWSVDPYRRLVAAIYLRAIKDALGLVGNIAGRQEGREARRLELQAEAKAFLDAEAIEVTWWYEYETA